MICWIKHGKGSPVLYLNVSLCPMAICFTPKTWVSMLVGNFIRRSKHINGSKEYYLLGQNTTSLQKTETDFCNFLWSAVSFWSRPLCQIFVILSVPKHYMEDWTDERDQMFLLLLSVFCGLLAFLRSHCVQPFPHTCMYCYTCKHILTCLCFLQRSCRFHLQVLLGGGGGGGPFLKSYIKKSCKFHLLLLSVFWISIS